MDRHRERQNQVHQLGSLVVVLLLVSMKPWPPQLLPREHVATQSDVTPQGGPSLKAYR